MRSCEAFRARSLLASAASHAPTPRVQRQIHLNTFDPVANVQAVVLITVKNLGGAG